MSALPNYPVIFAACDSKYFLEHAAPFCISCSEHGFDVHVHVVNPNQTVYDLGNRILSSCDTKVTYSFEQIDVTDLSLDEERTVYACTRFVVLPQILEACKSVLVLDIDCLVVNKFKFPTKPCGYFPRDENTNPQMKVAAGAVYFSEESIELARSIIEEFRSISLSWFADQIAISRAFAGVDNAERFDNKFMDWEFVEGTCIWTGKGPRKYDNPKYLEKKNYYNALLS